MKYCPDCGCENLDEAQFCRNCGLKFDAEVQKSSQKISKTNQNLPAVADNTVISKLFFKRDNHTGELRIAKAKSISIGVFVIMFTFSMLLGVEGLSFFVLILTSIIFASIFAIPTYIIGFIIGFIADKISD